MLLVQLYDIIYNICILQINLSIRDILAYNIILLFIKMILVYLAENLMYFSLL